MTYNGRTAGYAMLRVTTGFVFFFFGLEKLLGGVGSFVAGLHEQFGKTWLPPILVGAFGHALPFLEMTTGVLLVLGLGTRYALLLAGVLLVVLTSGLTIAGNGGGVAHNLIYAIVVYLLLRSEADNGYALDRPR